jgi:carboxyl-terminal processing protease
MKKLFYLLFVLSALSFSACKSNKKSNPTPTGPSKTGSTLDLIRDSVFLYAQEDYLWNTALPNYATFNPRSFTAGDDLTALSNEVNALSQYAINPATGKPYEYYVPNPGEAKYSFIDAGAVSAELNGTKGDYGLGVQYNDANDLRITYVYPGSPADIAHIKRGYQVTSVNGRTSLAYDGDGTSANLNFLNDAFFNSNTIALVLKKPDGTSLTVPNLAVANYTVNPVLKDTVYTVATGKKVGYIVFNSFTSDDNADPQLNAAFNYFTAQGITDLVVDLRYNGGGYVSTAEYIDNLIVPAAKTGSLMYNTYYNSILTSNKEVLLKNQWRRDPTTGQDYNYGQFSYAVADNVVNFAKMGTLNVSRVFFIMTGSTASASELTINNLRPVMDVQFVGSTSYGKPVGFFDIDINKYQMYIPEFYTQNSANQGGYYNGFTPGNAAAGYPGVAADDDMTKDFGDPTEGLLARILNYVKNGSYVLPVTTNSIQSVSTLSLNQKNAMAIKMNKNKFTGMIGNRKMKLKK